MQVADQNSMAREALVEAQQFFAASDFKTVLKICKPLFAAAEHKPADAYQQLFVLAGRACAQLEMFEPAEQALRKAVTLDARHGETWRVLCHVLTKNPKATPVAVLEAHSQAFAHLNPCVSFTVST